LDSNSAIIIFTRYPEPGLTKTRLIPELGPQGAAQLHKNLVQRIVGTVRSYIKDKKIKLIISFDHSDIKQTKNWLGSQLKFLKQKGDTLGNKMNNSLNSVLGNDVDKAILIGTDIPEISSKHLGVALTELENYDTVLGPASDGGYYLIGMNRDSCSPKLFQNINWGGAGVLNQTLNKIIDLGSDYYLLDKLNDIDTPEDLKKLKQRKPKLYSEIMKG
jgi:hypothetical protein